MRLECVLCMIVTALCRLFSDGRLNGSLEEVSREQAGERSGMQPAQGRSEHSLSLINEKICFGGKWVTANRRRMLSRGQFLCLCVRVSGCVGVCVGGGVNTSCVLCVCCGECDC